MFQISRIALRNPVKPVERILGAQLVLKDVIHRSMYMGKRLPPPARKTYESPTTRKHLEDAEKTRTVKIPPDFRSIYPEFLPDPKIEWRNPIREKIERLDLVNRR